MKPAQVYEFMKEFYGGEENIPFSKKDCDNEIRRERREYLEANDTQTLSEYLRNKHFQDPTFFYAIQVDKEDSRIANFFWADGQSIMDYKCFGDAVSFDTTFKTNKSEMPFAPFFLQPSQANNNFWVCTPIQWNYWIIFLAFWNFSDRNVREAPQHYFLQIKMRLWQEQLLMYSEIQATVYVCGTFA